MLIELLDLAAQAKQAHWNVTGPGFKPVHEQLDQLTLDLRGQADRIAERAVTIGFPPDGRIATVTRPSPLPELPTGRIPTPQAVAIIGQRLMEVADRARLRIMTVGESDAVTQGLLIELTAVLDRHGWMFTVQAQA
jgi:starvation-inducible DNA-binding protein